MVASLLYNVLAIITFYVRDCRDLTAKNIVGEKELQF